MTVLPDDIGWLTCLFEGTEFLSWQNVKRLRMLFVLQREHDTLLLFKSDEGSGRSRELCHIFIKVLLDFLFRLVNLVPFLSDDC